MLYCIILRLYYCISTTQTMFNSSIRQSIKNIHNRIPINKYFHHATSLDRASTMYLNFKKSSMIGSTLKSTKSTYTSTNTPTNISTIDSVLKPQINQYQSTPFNFGPMHDQEQNNSNESVKQYDMRVKIATGKFLCITGISAASTIGILSTITTYGIMNPLTTFIATCCVSFGSFFGSTHQFFHLKNDKLMPKAERLDRANWAHILMGAFLAPGLNLFNASVSTVLIPLITTGFIFLGSNVIAHNLQKDLTLSWNNALYNNMNNLFAVSIVSAICLPICVATSIFNGEIGVPTFIDSMLVIMAPTATTIMLTICNGHDTQNLIKDFENGNKDVINHAITYSTNIIGLFGCNQLVTMLLLSQWLKLRMMK